jgi:hypothetical protein
LFDALFLRDRVDLRVLHPRDPARFNRNLQRLLDGIEAGFDRGRSGSE